MPCGRGENRKLPMAHMDQSAVIPSLEINFRLLLDAVIDNQI
jgi:hypothetical protein